MLRRLVASGPLRTSSSSSSGMSRGLRPRGRGISDVASTEEFQRLTAAGGPPTLAFYTAPWCGPCQEVAPHIDDISGRLEGRHLRILRIDVDAMHNLAREQGIKAVPQFEVHREGHVVERLAGCGPEAVAEAAARHAADYAEMLKKKEER
mmetsp:Transcript_97416/g.247700  ORF Transcript_97416/g.247700 Transcript_97416/m.247700 type:complete len:150 (-) Transcript_97416:43-492(-)